jgi:hypothetical protein
VPFRGNAIRRASIIRPISAEINATRGRGSVDRRDGAD